MSIYTNFCNCNEKEKPYLIYIYIILWLPCCLAKILSTEMCSLIGKNLSEIP
jgi:hypothetical protein